MANTLSYLPPNVYTQTTYQPPTPAALASVKLPVFIGEGNEFLVQSQLEVIRGSSATADQRIVSEDETGRMVVSISSAGAITFGGFNGVLDKFQVGHYPITSGDGTGKATTNRNDVQVYINNQPVVVRNVDGTRGIVQIAQPPVPGDALRCTYFFKRTDTLITDDVSAQVDPNAAIVRAMFGIGDVNAPNPTSPVTVLDLHDDLTNVPNSANNVLTLTVDGSTSSIRIPPRTNYTMAQVASAITAARVGTLTATTFVDNYGHSALQMSATNSLVVLDGSANGVLGLDKSLQSNRVATFYTFQGPIVTGSGGGVTATDPSQVTVKVNGQQVIPTAVDGANRAVTLAVAPAAGSVVTVQYYFNSWQDTFDYLAHVGVSQVTACGDSPQSTSYVQGADFILQNDKILWGTAVTTESGVHTDQATYFGTDQITTLLIDNRTFLTECSAVVVAGSASQTTFQLAFDPTLGNGRDTPLGQSLFQTVSNSRIDLPVNRPDVVWAYWGWDAQDALERGQVTVLKVEGNVITLSEPVPVGARLFASFYYNTLTDDTYTLTCVNPGASGVGTYTVAKTGDQPVFGTTFSTSSKGAALNGVVLEFPSGSELSPDVHFEGGSGNDFTGPVEETVTVQFASRQATPARYTAPGAGPYEFIKGQSDHLRMTVHANDLGTNGLDLDNPSEHGGGFFASLVGNEIAYPDGQQYDIPASEQVLVTIDGVDVLAKTSDNLTGVTASVFADAINEAASGHQGTAGVASGGGSDITLNVAKRSNVTDRYVGWVVVLGAGGAGTAGESRVVQSYNGTTGVATMSAAWTVAPIATNPYYIYDPAARSALAGATVFNGPVTLAANKHDHLKVIFHGATSGLATLNCIVANTAAAALAATGSVTIGSAGVGHGDTVTIAGVPFTCVENKAVGTVLVNGACAAADTVVINGVTFTAQHGGPYGVAAFSDAQVPATDITSATSLVTQINSHPTVGLIIVASNAGGTSPTVTLTAVVRGLVGEYTLVGTAGRLTESGPTMVMTPADTTACEFEGLLSVVGGTATDVANSLETSINDNSGPGAGQPLLKTAIGFTTETVAALNVGPIVGLTYSVVGYHGPKVTLATSDAVNITLSRATLAFPAANYVFATVGDLADGVSSSLASEIADSVTGTPARAGLRIVCSPNSTTTQLEFVVQLPGVDAAGYLQFLSTAGTPADDFCILAGLDTAASEGLGQAALLQGPVAKTYMCPASGVLKPYDRIRLRNRILPGGGSNSSLNASAVVSQTGLEIKAASTKTGLEIGMTGLAERTATVKAATVVTSVSLAGGFDSNAEVQLTFYDGTGTRAANNVFSFNVDGYAVNVTLAASGAGTTRALGPTTVGSSTTILDQIQDALAALAGAPFGTRAAVYNSKIIRQEGCGFRITGLAYDTTAKVAIGSGSANGTLGLTAGRTALRTTVPAKVLASALEANRNSTFVTYMTVFTSTEALKFATYGLASVENDTTGLEYLYVQDAPVLVANLGAASTLEFQDPSPNVANALAIGTLLNTVDGDGATGEVAVNGFFVVSNDLTHGSGSIDTSILNPGGGSGGIGVKGSGQDGMVGQTYRDSVTGLTFTILPRGFHNNPNGPWIAYPTGATAMFRFASSTTFKTNANIPTLAVNGVEMKVANTVGVTTGDSAVVTTYQRGGNEPSIGDTYYVSYFYEKQDFTTAFYQSLSAIEQTFGAVSPDNPLSLAAFLAITNGAVIVGLKQVPREPGSNYASLATYRDAITELEGVLPGNVKLDMITPLRGDSTDLFQVLKRSNDIQSSPRYRSERTSIIGMAAGSLPVAAGNLAQVLNHSRMRLVYPDSAVISIQDNSGATQDYVIDGPYLAAALSGSVVSPNLDVATPWTGRRLVGFTQLGRQLDAVQQNQLAVKGVTILEDQPPFIRVRHGLTTDMTGATTDGNAKLSQLPTIMLIADEVQQQTRDTLSVFIGVKFLPGVLSQIEGKLSAMLRGLVTAQIITAYTGVSATPDSADATTADVSAWYSPVLPLLFVMVQFNLRSSLA